MFLNSFVSAPSLISISVAGFCILNTSFSTGPKPQTDLEQVLYDMGVIGYCNLSSPEVLKGYSLELEQIIKRDNLSEQNLKDTTNSVWTMVEWEWNNRGLGGFRGWCRTEGEAAVNRFLSVQE